MATRTAKKSQPKATAKQTTAKKATAKKASAKQAATKQASPRARAESASPEIGDALFARWKGGEKLSAIATDLGWRVGKVRATIAKAAGGKEAWKAMRDARTEQPRRVSVPRGDQ